VLSQAIIDESQYRARSRQRGRGLATFAALLAALLLITVAASAGPARAAGPLVWHVPQLVDGQATPKVGGMQAVACTAGSLCIASGGPDIATSTLSVRGSSPWKLARVPITPKGLSCPSRSLCVGVAGDYVVTSTDPTGGSTAWTATRIPAWDANTIRAQGGITSVSCASTSLCVAAGGAGTVAVSTDPTGGPGAWDTYQVPTSVPEICGKYGPGTYCQANLTGISCPSRSLCVAVDDPGNSTGDIIASANPVGGVSTWKTTPLDTRRGGGLMGVSCPTASLCAAVDYADSLFTSRAPGAGASAWRMTNIAFHVPHAYHVPEISCGSICVETVGDAAATSTDPTGGSSTWTVTHIDSRSPRSLNAVSCTTSSDCVAVDGAGYAVVGMPAARTSAWLSRELVDSARAARIPVLLARGSYTFLLRAPSPGHLRVSWYRLPSDTPVQHLQPQLVATGQASVKAGRIKIALQLTPKGRQLLQRHHRLRISMRGSFSPTGWSTLTVTRIGSLT
jgi:hypothetical protein